MSALSSAGNVTEATDVDALVSMGFEIEQAKCALHATKGDRASAVQILMGNVKATDKNASAWREEVEDDFIAGLSGKPLPSNAAMRALWKSPLYCRISEAQTTANITWYTIRAITKLGMSFNCIRRYKQFFAFKMSLPFGTCKHFQNAFPLPSLRRFVDVEKRRTKLEEWLREFVLDEGIMTNPSLLLILYEFLEYEQGILQLRDKMESTGTGKSISGSIFEITEKEINRRKFKESNPFEESDEEADEDMAAYRLSAVNFVKSSPDATASAKSSSMPLQFDDFGQLSAMKRIGSVSLVSKALPFEELNLKLPFKTQVLRPGRDVNESGKDETRKQLKKDFSRDRIIVQNHRIEGSKHTLEQLVIIMKHAINSVLQYNIRPKLSTNERDDEKNTQFCLSILASIARTQSAFLAHYTLSQIVLQDPDVPVAIIPESSMADPINIRFSVKQRNNDAPTGVGDYCLLVEMDAGAVFRLSDPLDDNVATLLQVHVRYCCSAFGMPTTVHEQQTSPRSLTATGISDDMIPFSVGKRGPGACSDEVRTTFVLKEGKSWMLFEKDMRSTTRDWHE